MISTGVVDVATAVYGMGRSPFLMILLGERPQNSLAPIVANLLEFGEKIARNPVYGLCVYTTDTLI